MQIGAGNQGQHLGQGNKYPVRVKQIASKKSLLNQAFKAYFAKRKKRRG